MKLIENIEDLLPEDVSVATLVGRVFDPEVDGPCVVVVRGDQLVDISHDYPTVSDLLESTDPLKTEVTVHAMVPRLVVRSSTAPPQAPTHR